MAANGTAATLPLSLGHCRHGSRWSTTMVRIVAIAVAVGVLTLPVAAQDKGRSTTAPGQTETAPGRASPGPGKNLAPGQLQSDRGGSKDFAPGAAQGNRGPSSEAKR